MKYLKILLGLTVGVVWLQTSMASEKKLEIIKKGDKGTKYKLFKLTSSQKELAKLERTPKLIWVKIVSALSKKDLLNLSCTSKTLYNKAQNYTKFFIPHVFKVKDDPINKEIFYHVMKSPKYRKLFEEKLKTFCQNCGIERKNYQKIIYQDLYCKYAPPNLVGTSSNSALLPAKNNNNLLKDKFLFKDCRSAAPVRKYVNGIHNNINDFFSNFQNFQSTLSNFIDNDNTNLVENEGGETNAKQTTLPTVPNLFANRKYVVFSKLQHTEFLMKKGVAYHIIIKGCEYDKVKELLNKIFLANPNNTLVYDIGEKNIDSKTHTLSMKSNFFYESIRKLNLTDSAEIVKIIGDYFMAHNRSLTKLAFTFPKLQEIGNSFLYYNRTKLIEFTLMAPSVKKNSRPFYDDM